MFPRPYIIIAFNVACGGLFGGFCHQQRCVAVGEHRDLNAFYYPRSLVTQLGLSLDYYPFSDVFSSLPPRGVLLQTETSYTNSDKEAHLEGRLQKDKNKKTYTREHCHENIPKKTHLGLRSIRTSRGAGEGRESIVPRRVRGR